MQTNLKGWLASTTPTNTIWIFNIKPFRLFQRLQFKSIIQGREKVLHLYKNHKIKNPVQRVKQKNSVRIAYKIHKKIFVSTRRIRRKINLVYCNNLALKRRKRLCQLTNNKCTTLLANLLRVRMKGSGASCWLLI